MIDYVGDLSREDAELLAGLADEATRILEFGAGASTQIFAAFSNGIVHCVETDPQWIARTRANLERLDLELRVQFRSYAEFQALGPYDLIFVDGIDELRLEFAIRTWPDLRVGGLMCFHDTRRTVPHGIAKTTDLQNVCRLIERFPSEIETVDVNFFESNTTLVTKRAPLHYVDWNVAEGRTPEQIGLA